MKTLTATQINQFNEQGYLVVENVVGADALQRLWAEYSALLAEVADRMAAQGQLSKTYPHLPFDERYVALLNEDSGVFQQLEISLPLVNDNFPPEANVHCGPAVFELLTHPKLLDVVESIIGPEIYSNPVQHIRLKPPAQNVPASIMENSYVGKTTWHQDMAALLEEADETEVLSAWVAVTDAPQERGCLVVMPGSHKKEGGALTVHCPGTGITAENYIPARLLGDDRAQKKPVALPVGRGGVVLLHRFTEHAALPNKSGQLRWSFDLRYNPVGQATGRPAFPGFVARSRAHPEAVLTDPEQWAQLWETARRQLAGGERQAPIFNAARWEAFKDTPMCA